VAVSHLDDRQPTDPATISARALGLILGALVIAAFVAYWLLS
jgi:hypothetical protein